jgi:putative NADH-flavin reductase
VGELARLDAVRGDVLDRQALDTALDGMDVVVSSIGMDRGGDFPWRPLRVPDDLHSTTMAHLVAGMEERAMDRLVLVSAHGVGDSWEDASWVLRALVAGSTIGKAYRDLARAEQVLQQSRLDWTIVRPTRLTDQPGEGRWRAERRLSTGMFSSVSRDDVAAFLLQSIEEGVSKREIVSLDRAMGA